MIRVSNLPLAIVFGIRYLRSRQTTLVLVSRTSFIGLVLAITILYLIQAIISGFQSEMREKIIGVIPHAKVVVPDDPSTHADLEIVLSNHSDVVAYTQTAESNVLLSTDRKVMPARLIGVDPSQFLQTTSLPKFDAANALGDFSAGDFHVVLGDQLAQSLGIELGEPIAITLPSFVVTPLGLTSRFRNFVVTGIINTDSVLDYQLAYTHIEHVANALQLANGVNRYQLRVSDPFEVRAVVSSIMRSLPLSTFAKVHISAWQDSYGVLYEFLSTMKKVFFLLLSLLVVVASFNLVSTIVMLVQERRSDIAILRSFGGRTLFVCVVFMLPAATIATLGTLTGAVLAWLLSLILEAIYPWIVATMNLEGVQRVFLQLLDVEFNLVDFVNILAFCLGLSMLAAIYPAYKAATLDPAEVLRDE